MEVALTIECDGIWFDAIADGIIIDGTKIYKFVEGRKNSPTFRNLKIGDYIKIINKTREFIRQVKDLRRYKTFDDFVEHEWQNNILPGIEKKNAWKDVYGTFWTEEEVLKYGMLAIDIRL